MLLYAIGRNKHNVANEYQKWKEETFLLKARMQIFYETMKLT